MTVSIHLTDTEYQLADSCAKRHSLTMAEAFTQTLLEQIEEEYDRTVWAEAYQNYVKDGKKSQPIAALWQEIGI